MEEKAVTRYNPIAFINSLLVELKAIEWPSRNRALQLTFIVVGVSLVFGLAIGGFDYILTIGLDQLIKLRG